MAVEGGLHASLSTDRTYRVSKVLVVDDVAVQRICADRFAALPASLSSDRLAPGSLGGTGGFGAGHAPVSREGFEREDRVLIRVEAVRDEALDGYRIRSGEDA